jgi:hypothetical protein
MFNFGRRADDTSPALDRSRAVAAQMVCVGRAINSLSSHGAQDFVTIS